MFIIVSLIQESIDDLENSISRSTNPLSISLANALTSARRNVHFALS